MTFEADLIFSITQFANAFRDALDKSLRAFGLYGGQIYILISLWEKDGQTQIALAKRLNLSPPTIHKMLKSLAANGFIHSRQCEEDARQMRVYLTIKGGEIRPSVEKLWIAVEAKTFASLTETEKLIFRQLLEKLKADLINRG